MLCLGRSEAKVGESLRTSRSKNVAGAFSQTSKTRVWRRSKRGLDFTNEPKPEIDEKYFSV